MGRVHLASRYSALIRSISSVFDLILLFFMFLAKNMLKIFKAINKKSMKAEIAFWLLLFTCVNIFNIFLTRNIKDRAIKTKVFLIGKIKAEFLSLKKPLPPVPV